MARREEITLGLGVFSPHLPHFLKSLPGEAILVIGVYDLAARRETLTRPFVLR
jgi:hypothetical protein